MFKAPFSFEGRIRRLEYGLSMLFYIIGYVIICVAMFLVVDMGGIGGLVFLGFIPLVWFVWAQGAGLK